MTGRAFLGILIAFAMLLAPVVARTGEALAAVPDHQGQMMMSGHCKAEPVSGGDDEASDHGMAAGKACCVSMCMAVAVTPTAPVADKLFERVPAVFLTRSLQEIPPAELATPPPRLS